MGAYGAEQIAAADLSSDGPTQRSGEDRKGAAEQRSEGGAERSYRHHVRRKPHITRRKGEQ